MDRTMADSYAEQIKTLIKDKFGEDSIASTKASFSPGELTITLVVRDVSTPEAALEAITLKWALLMRGYPGLTEEQLKLGAMVNGQRMAICDINPKSRKAPVRVKNAAGKFYAVPCTEFFFPESFKAAPVAPVVTPRPKFIAPDKEIPLEASVSKESEAPLVSAIPFEGDEHDAW